MQLKHTIKRKREHKNVIYNLLLLLIIVYEYLASGETTAVQAPVLNALPATFRMVGGGHVAHRRRHVALVRAPVFGIHERLDGATEDNHVDHVIVRLLPWPHVLVDFVFL